MGSDRLSSQKCNIIKFSKKNYLSKEIDKDTVERHVLRE